MAYLYDLPNATNLDGIILQLSGENGATPFLVPMILFFVFMVVFLGGVIRQKTRIGTSDYSAWAVLASISTLLIGLLFSVTAGYIRVDILVILVVLTISSGIWFFFDRKGSEL